MKCIILAAGYATRLYPLTENYPKPLLKVNNKRIIDWLIEDISKSKDISDFYVVSNHKFIKNFEKWNSLNNKNIKIIDDGSISNETRLGAVKDIQLVIEKEKIDDDILVLAGDNVLDFSLLPFIDYFKEKKASCILRYFEKDFDKIKKSGNLILSSKDKVEKMLEKPRNPESHWCVPPFYIYSKNDLPKIKEAIDNGCNIDAPGSLISYLSDKIDIYAMKMLGKRYDIGNIDSYNKANKFYKGIIKN